MPFITLLVFSLLASGAQELVGRVTPIQAWCRSPDIFKEAISQRVQNGAEAATQYLIAAFSSGVCTKLPKDTAALFKADKIVARYSQGFSGREVVIAGKLTNGRKVYVWADVEHIPQYFKKRPDPSAPPI